MTRTFIDKVIKYRVVDSRKYRYICHEGDEGFYIERINREYLGTTWEIERSVIAWKGA